MALCFDADARALAASGVPTRGLLTRGMRRRCAGGSAAFVAAALVGAIVPRTARAQAGPGAACNYDDCALRREGVFFSQRVVAGAAGRVVARSGFSGFRLDSALAGSPRALVAARVHRREARAGSVLMLVGGVVSGVRIVQAARNDERANTAETTAIVAAGAVISVVGGWRMQIADRALNRALWWYNRDLPR